MTMPNKTPQQEKHNKDQQGKTNPSGEAKKPGHEQQKPGQHQQGKQTSAGKKD